MHHATKQNTKEEQRERVGKRRQIVVRRRDDCRQRQRGLRDGVQSRLDVQHLTKHGISCIKRWLWRQRSRCSYLFRELVVERIGGAARKALQQLVLEVRLESSIKSVVIGMKPVFEIRWR